MGILERLSIALVIALVVSLPFEFHTFPILSNLQWLFLAVAATSFPLLIRSWHKLVRERLVIASAIFVIVQWVCALGAGEFTGNSAKAAVRVTAGFALLCVILCQSEKRPLLRIWYGTSIAAACYGLVDYMGFGVFSHQEFYFGYVLRLSGSFEYPTTAAAFYALSLPIAWAVPSRHRIRVMGSVLLWMVLLLTYTRGAIIAVGVVMLAWFGYRSFKSALKLAVVGIALYGVVAGFQPALIERFGHATPPKSVAAEYQPEFNLLRLPPGSTSQLNVTVKNTGTNDWLAGEPDGVSISYHWYDWVRRRIVYVPEVRTALPRKVAPGEKATVSASFNTPQEPGSYLLVWDLTRGKLDWFSKSGVVPGIVEAQLDRGTTPWASNGDVSRWTRRGTDHSSIEADVSRQSLWRAAAGMIRENPILGSGPDNFRLLYGARLGYSGWDANVRANSLYLELLTGSGIAGLLAFAFMMISTRWRWNAPSMAIAIFMIHGLVDVFLMTTPIYFGFWILMGLASEKEWHG